MALFSVACLLAPCDKELYCHVHTIIYIKCNDTIQTSDMEAGRHKSSIWKELSSEKLHVLTNNVRMSPTCKFVNINTIHTNIKTKPWRTNCIL